MNNGRPARAAMMPAPLAGTPRGTVRDADFDGAHFLALRNARLRGLRFADVAELSSLHQAAGVRRVLLEPAPTAFVEIAGLVIRANRVYIEQPGLGLWHASTQDGSFLGVLSLLLAAGAGSVELGLRLVPEQAASDAVGDGIKALCAHAFEALGLLSLSAQVHVDDAAARRWLLACGFAEVGESLRHGPCARAFVLDQAGWRRPTFEVAAPGS